MFIIFKGTSAAAPLWAGITARLMANFGVAQVQKDFQNGGYYKTLSFHDITSGSNGYSTGTGWDAVTGMGSFAKYTPSSNTPTTTSSFTTTTACFFALMSLIYT